MNKLVIYLLVFILVIGGIWFVAKNGSSDKNGTTVPTAEEAEEVGFNFMLDFVKIAPPESDLEAQERAYNTLSSNAKENINEDSIVIDLAMFVGVQDVPDQGISVENLEVIDEENVILVLGLNYSGSRAFRALNLIVEDGEWKVDSITSRESVTSNGTVTPSPLELPAVAEVLALIASNQDISPTDVVVLSAEAKDWPDGCLGLADSEEMCTQAIVPGYEVVVQVKGENQKFRTNLTGAVIRQEI